MMRTGTTTQTFDAEAYGRAVVKGRSLGFYQLGCGRQGQEWAHRVARSRGGTWAPVCGLWLCSRHHAATHQAPRLSRACGWMVDTGIHPSTVPALIATQIGHGWFWLDEMGHDGRPTGLARLAEPGDVPAWMWPHGFDAALAALGRAAA